MRNEYTLGRKPRPYLLAASVLGVSNKERLRYQRRLALLNWAAAILHFGSGIAIAWLIIRSSPWKVFATVRHVLWEPVNPSDAGQSCADVPCKIGVEEVVVGELYLEWIVFQFHTTSAMHHLVVAWLCPDLYHRYLDNKMQPFRWVDYALSASTMQVVILVLCGFTDVWTLSLGAVAIATTQIFGHVIEQVLFLGYDKLRCWSWIETWQYYLYGWVPFVTPWVAVYWSFYDSIARADPGPPDWVKGVVWSLLVAFACFAFNMAYYVSNYSDPFISYKAEVIYAWLSLIAKAALAWQLYYGAYGRSDRELVAWRPDGG